MKNQRNKKLLFCGWILLLILLLAACGKSGGNEQEAQKGEANDKFLYTTIKGDQIELPKNPQRVIYIGDNVGDSLVMKLPIVGANLVNASEIFYGDLTAGITDVGNPGDLELIASIQPDLIVNGYSRDEERHEALSKIAVTVPFNPALPYNERVVEMGKIFNMEEEAAQWNAKFAEQSKEMWKKIQVAEGETATVFLQLGKTLYVMGNRSLGAILYQEEGFKVPTAIQKNIIDEKLSFMSVSEELLTEFAGDHLFVLIMDSDESKEEANRILESPLWKTLPAVEQGKVYLASADWNTDSLLALEQLLEEIPQWMNKE